MKSSYMGSALVMISAIALSLAGCGSKQDPDQGKVASLPDLPQADVDKLKLTSK